MQFWPEGAFIIVNLDSYIGEIKRNVQVRISWKVKHIEWPILNLPVRLAHTLHDEIFPLAQNLWRPNDSTIEAKLEQANQ